MEEKGNQKKSNSKKDNPFTIRMPQDLKQQCDEYAKAKGITRSKLIIEAVKLFLKEKKTLKIEEIGEIWLLLYRQLDIDLEKGLVLKQREDLTKKIKNAGYDIKIEVFNQTHLFFKQCLKKIKSASTMKKNAKLLKRAIPILDSLITNNDENTRKFHRVYAYLAYCLDYIDTYAKKEDNINLKDLYQQSPLELIDKAIEIRTNNNELNPEFYIYEFKRALFKLKYYHQIDKQEETSTSKEFLNELIEDLKKSIKNCKLVQEICQCLLEEEDFREKVLELTDDSDNISQECNKIKESTKYKALKHELKEHHQTDKQEETSASQEFLDKFREEFNKSTKHCELVEKICQYLLLLDEDFREKILEITNDSDITFQECNRIREFGSSNLVMLN